MCDLLCEVERGGRQRKRGKKMVDVREKMRDRIQKEREEKRVRVTE